MNITDLPYIPTPWGNASKYSSGGEFDYDSPEFTGIPISPTAALNTNTNQIATTAFVINQIANFSTTPESSLATPLTIIKRDATGGFSSGAINITDTTESTDSITGALKIAGGVGIDKDLNVAGTITTANLNVTGTTTTVNTETVTIKDNIILINSTQTGTPISTLLSGIEVERGDLTNYQFLFEENTKTFKIGTAGNLQPVATRDNSPIANSVPYWDNANSKYSSSGLTISGSTITGDLIGNATTATYLGSNCKSMTFFSESTEKWCLLANLPVSSGATRDYCSIDLIAGFWWALQKESKFLFKNRESFQYSAKHNGDIFSETKIQAYLNADSTVNIYLYLDNNYKVASTLIRGDGFTFKSGEESITTPTGTLIYDSSYTTTYSYTKTYDSTNSDIFLRSDTEDTFNGILVSGSQPVGIKFTTVSNASTPTFATSADLITGGSDYAGLAKLNNIAVQTWFGFSVSPTISGPYAVPQGTPAFSVDARTGEMYVFSNINFGNGTGKCRMIYNSTEDSIDFIIN